jgi:uncharacterized protein HemX
MTEPDMQTMPLDNQPEVIRRRKTSFLASAAFVLALVALSIIAWQWLNTRHRFTELEHILSKRLEQYNANNQQSLALSSRADERSTEAAARAVMLEQRLAESRDQQEALQTLYLELANNQEERVIAEVEQLMIIANQQLQLASSVKPALLALQSADKRLQHLDSPQAIQIRKAIAQDIGRLQSLPLVDIAGMNLKLEALINSIDQLPLVSDRHPAVPPPSPTLKSTTQGLLLEIWQDIKGMIRLERVDRPEPPLLAPDQVFFLRENIKLRLLTARIALLQHDEVTYRADLKAAEQWLQGYFDMREAATKHTLTGIRQLSANNIVIQLPDISESLNLVSKYKLTLEKGS